MFNTIENLYKKESRFNKLGRVVSIWYGLLFGVLAIIGFYKLSWKSTIFLPILIIIILLINLKCINVKLTINIKKLFENIDITRSNMYQQDVNIIKKAIIKNEWYNLKTINLFIEHYRSLIGSKTKLNNFWAIVSVLLSLIITVIKKNAIDFNLLFYILFILIICLLLHWLYIQFSNIIIFLKGEEYIYERLEEIFCDIYAELVNKNNLKNHKRKTTNKRKS